MSAAHAQRALAMLQRAKKRGVATSVSISRPGAPGDYNPETGEMEGGTEPVVHTGVGVKVGYEQSDIDGSTIRQGDQRVYADAVNLIRPQSNEQILVGGQPYVAVSVEVIAPGDIDVLYIIQIRGV